MGTHTETVFGRRLKEQRELRKLAQEGLARALGVSFKQVNRWEKGHAMPRPETIDQIVNFFGVPGPWSIGRSPSPLPGPCVGLRSSARAGIAGGTPSPPDWSSAG